MTTETQAHAQKWSPAKPRQDGVFLDEHKLPLNHRLRAEALAQAGAPEDPGGQVSPEVIADTAARLEAEKADAAAAEKPLAEQTIKELRATAERLQISLPAKGKHGELLAEIERVLRERAEAVAAEPASDEGNNGQ
ncbi:MAG TPA: hypothetical protein VEC11_07790 [Allosphingosinicella sp.]|nr:hypothetical protein [Allosphingosinicella sp.]